MVTKVRSRHRGRAYAPIQMMTLRQTMPLRERQLYTPNPQAAQNTTSDAATVQEKNTATTHVAYQNLQMRCNQRVALGPRGRKES